MASGSTAPFSGEFSELENVPTLPEGLSANDIIQSDSNGLKQAAEARHAAGLSQINADGGFFDAYVDKSKIDSSTDISLLGTAGKAIAGSTSTVSRDPDGDSFSNSEANGITINPNTSISEITVEVSGNADGISEVGVTDTSGSKLASKTGSFTSGDKITLSVTLSSGTKYYVYAYNGGSNYTYGQDLNPSFPYSGTNIDIVSGVTGVLGFPNQNSSTAYNFISVESVGIASSGTITQSQFTFTDSTGTAFVPSKIGLFPEFDTSGTNESISFDLVNSSGTTVKTFQESDLNQLQSVSVSDDTFHVEANLSGDGTSSPEIKFLDVRGV